MATTDLTILEPVARLLTEAEAIALPTEAGAGDGLHGAGPYGFIPFPDRPYFEYGRYRADLTQMEMGFMATLHVFVRISDDGKCCEVMVCGTFCGECAQTNARKYWHETLTREQLAGEWTELRGKLSERMRAAYGDLAYLAEEPLPEHGVRFGEVIEALWRSKIYEGA